MMQAISVTKFNSYIKNIFDAEELLHNISIVGEVFGVSISRNVIYFSLRDAEASLSCVCFYPALFDEIVEGSEIIVTGSPNYYVKGGRLSFAVTKIEKSGQGKLYEEFLRLKEKLEKEGLFDSSHKKQIPSVIKRIGVITSKDGAVIQDIKNVGWRRNPALDIVLYSTRVQGKGAENEIAHAIDVMGTYENIDCIVVARGGGSLEDLWAYNTEIVARAAYNCPKPIISAVGHEVDFTIIDFVSDLRAPTPSAAAELLTINVDDKREKLSSYAKRLVSGFEDFVYDNMGQVENYANRLINGQEKFILDKSGKLKHLALKFGHNAERFLEERVYNLGLVDKSLTAFNPTAMLERGFAKIEQSGRPVTAAKQVDYEKDLKIYFKDGTVKAKPQK